MRAYAQAKRPGRRLGRLRRVTLASRRVRVYGQNVHMLASLGGTCPACDGSQPPWMGPLVRTTCRPGGSGGCAHGCVHAMPPGLSVQIRLRSAGVARLKRVQPG